MKKNTYKKVAAICFLTWLGAAASLTAQSYVPFPKENTYWTSAHCEYGPTEYRSGIIKTGIFGDTTIHNKVYHKMYLQTKFVHTGNCTTCDFAFDLDSAYYFFAFREKNRKIYVVPTGYNRDGKEYLVYDFTAHQVGDTVKAHPMEFFFAPGHIQSVVSEDIKGYAVKSITRVNLSDGTKRKKYTFDPFQLESWIEGIGSTKFLNPFFQVTDIGDKLLCFSSNGVNYSNTTVGQNCDLDVYTCEFTSPPINGLSNAGTTVKNTEEFNVYPNPVRDHLQLEGVPENGTAHIVNILGIEVLSIKSAKKEEMVDLSMLNPGIYMLQVCDVQGNCTVKRLIKE
jgi:hypothetical protein